MIDKSYNEETKTFTANFNEKNTMCKLHKSIFY